MNKIRLLLLTGAVLVVALFGVWAVQGFNIYTKTSYPVTTTDELFGTTSVVWKPGFLLGLDLAGAAAAVTVAAAAGGWWYLRRKGMREERKRTSSHHSDDHAGDQRPKEKNTLSHALR